MVFLILTNAGREGRSWVTGLYWQTCTVVWQPLYQAVKYLSSNAPSQPTGRILVAVLPWKKQRFREICDFASTGILGLRELTSLALHTKEACHFFSVSRISHITHITFCTAAWFIGEHTIWHSYFTARPFETVVTFQTWSLPVPIWFIAWAQSFPHREGSNRFIGVGNFLEIHLLNALYL